jgi:hypothetical protein
LRISTGRWPQALEQAPVGDKYAQVSYETLVKMRRELKDILAPAMNV